MSIKSIHESKIKMTVKELRDKLENMDDDMEVMVVNVSQSHSAYDITDMGRSVYNEFQHGMFVMLDNAVEKAKENPNKKVIFVLEVEIDRW
jgi:hypothetical protein